jgi:segregation and condensation protein B
MDYFGINSAEDLPKIREVLADQVVQPTIIKDTDFESAGLIVTGEGELIGEQTISNPSTEPVQNVVNGQPVDEEETGEAAEDTDATSSPDADPDGLSESDFPEEEQKEMEIEQTSDEIIFTSDEIEGTDLTPDRPARDDDQEPTEEDESAS